MKGFWLNATFSVVALVLVATSIGPVYAEIVDDEATIGFFCKYTRDNAPFGTHHCSARPLISCPFATACGFSDPLFPSAATCGCQ